MNPKVGKCHGTPLSLLLPTNTFPPPVFISTLENGKRCRKLHPLYVVSCRILSASNSTVQLIWTLSTIWWPSPPSTNASLSRQKYVYKRGPLTLFLIIFLLKISRQQSNTPETSSASPPGEYISISTAFHPQVQLPAPNNYPPDTIVYSTVDMVFFHVHRRQLDHHGSTLLQQVPEPNGHIVVLSEPSDIINCVLHTLYVRLLKSNLCC